MTNVLVTGGLGFIGSHTVAELIEAGHTPIILDNLINSDLSVLKRLQKLTGQALQFTEIDVRDTETVAKIIQEHSVTAIIHFAALKAVGESTEKPLMYYQNNIEGLLSILKAMEQSSVNRFIFSSSATVYGDPDRVPIYETDQLKETTNPYGETKKMAERIIRDVASTSELKSVLLRYFNPIGAHPSGLIGEQPRGIPNNLVPYVVQATAGVREQLTVHGNDYDTPDGSGVRDYIHVVDLAKAHVKAIKYVQSQNEPISIFNIGTGNGVSVLELIHTFEKINNVKVPYVIGPRRPGDVASCYAAAEKAEKHLDWKAQYSLEDALKDAWNWQQSSGL